MRIGVLASGEGTNLQVLLDSVHGREGLEVVAVGSDRPRARALERARAAAVAVRTFSLDAFPDRTGRDVAMADWLRSREVELVVLAGYMQLVGEPFLAAFAGRIINIHPALLPAFPGLDAVGQALAYGVKVFGVTVHFVDEGVDSGAVILQRAIELPDAQTREQVMKHLRPLEHALLPEAVRLLARGAVRIAQDNPRRVIVEREV